MGHSNCMVDALLRVKKSILLSFCFQNLSCICDRCTIIHPVNSSCYVCPYRSVCGICSKKREVVPDLAPMLWHSFGTIAALLQEIISIYPAINPPNLTVSNYL